MAGMARDTGAALDGLDHIRQSVADILSTPMGTRVGAATMARWCPS
jgi:phage baseplate assembly protein W